ncbi:MAG: hypothetical protein GXO77_07380 [Calditrichaeota bacterium]|nr:hypothetical protein [Calditrichota bacterium]
MLKQNIFPRAASKSTRINHIAGTVIFRQSEQSINFAAKNRRVFEAGKEKIYFNNEDSPIFCKNSKTKTLFFLRNLSNQINLRSGLLDFSHSLSYIFGVHTYHPKGAKQ